MKGKDDRNENPEPEKRAFPQVAEKGVHVPYATESRATRRARLVWHKQAADEDRSYNSLGMAKEIERKFLVTGTAWRKGAKGKRYRQGYLTLDPDCTVRVRIAGRQGFLTIKGISKGASRDEFEYPVPLADAHQLLRLCKSAIIEKTRYRIPHKGHTWEVDVFAGENRGLVVAELELKSERQSFPRPPWVGREVTDDPRYFNASLATKPFRRW